MLITGALTAGSSVATGLLGRGKTATSQPTWTPEQLGIQHQVADSLSAKLANPGDVYAPQRVNAIGQVNTNYSNLEQRLQKQFSGRGFGQSGQVLTNTRALESSRVGDIGGLNAQFAGMQTDYESHLLDQARSFGFASPGNTSTGPSDVAGGALSGGLSTLTTLLTLNKMMSGGGGNNGYMPPTVNPQYEHD